MSVDGMRVRDTTADETAADGTACASASSSVLDTRSLAETRDGVRKPPPALASLGTAKPEDAKMFHYKAFFTNISVFFFSSRRRHTRFKCDWSSDVCSS